MKKLRKPGEPGDAPEAYDDAHLRYAADVRCKCGAGVAYPPVDRNNGERATAWYCSEVLKGNVSFSPDTFWMRDFGSPPPTNHAHDAYPFWCYEIKSEDQPSAEGATTRPDPKESA